jgi:hypothetical protein
MNEGKKKRPGCAVNGRFRRGTMFGLCCFMLVGDNSKCGANENKKCKHKVEVKDLK